MSYKDYEKLIMLICMVITQGNISDSAETNLDIFSVLNTKIKTDLPIDSVF